MRPSPGAAPVRSGSDFDSYRAPAERVPVPRAYRPAGARASGATRAADRYRAALGAAESTGTRGRSVEETTRRLTPLMERYRDSASRSTDPLTVPPTAGPGQGRALRAENQRRGFEPAPQPAARPAATRARLSAAAGARPGSGAAAWPTEPSARLAAQVDARAKTTARLNELADENPEVAQRLAAAGSAVARANGMAVAIAGAAASGLPYGSCVPDLSYPPSNYCKQPKFWWNHPWYGFGYGGYGYGYGYGYGFGGYGFWGGGSYFSWSLGLGWCWSPYYWKYVCHPYTWHPAYGGYANYHYGYGAYSPYSPVATTYVIYEAAQAAPTTVYVEAAEPAPVEVVVESAAPSVRADAGFAPAAPVATAVGEGVAAGSDTGLSLAAERYLTLGDRAFREARFADAVHFYARAAALAPREGVLQLVLADALFATGDYRYGAIALRRAFELDPMLFDTPLDKRTFYGDSKEFDRQIAVLETYVLDHPADMDARLVLATNFYFGGRPAAAVDLLEDELSGGLAGDPLAEQLLSRARVVQYGERAKTD
ncbi:MAG: hypothetical protein GC161_00485 [Planctomycetaceae bacterium]|nr:hypothetical protein [Planctomycetaceae bacterium]